MAEDEEEGGYHRFILSWDMLGVEMVHDIDGEQSRRVEAALKGEVYQYQDPGQLMEKASLRARFNTHRNCEVYAIALPDHLSEDDVREMINGNFETMTGLIKKKGIKIY